MPDFMIPLAAPVGPKGKQISELTLREPKAGEVIIASTESGNKMARSLLTQILGVGDDVVGAIPVRKSDAAFEYLLSFIVPLTAETKELPADLPDEITIDLPEPIQLGMASISELTLREPTLGEIIKAERQSGMLKTAVLMASMAGQSRIVIEALPISVFTKAAVYVLGFTGAGRQSGDA